MVGDYIGGIAISFLFQRRQYQGVEGVKLDRVS